MQAGQRNDRCRGRHAHGVSPTFFFLPQEQVGCFPPTQFPADDRPIFPVIAAHCRQPAPSPVQTPIPHQHVDLWHALPRHYVRSNVAPAANRRANARRSYGESHCLSVGCIVDGCPPGMQLTEADIQPQMTRRRPGQSAITTPRNEKDRVEIQSGTEFGVTLGTPIGMRVMNENQRPKDYGNSTMDLYPRPSHADWTYLEKYGVKASSGGGRSSARETIGKDAFDVCACCG